MFKKRFMMLIVPVVLAAWAAHAQDGVKTLTVAQAAAPAQLNSPDEFKAFISKMLTGPDQKLEVIIEKHHGTFEKRGNQMILMGDGKPTQTMTLEEAQDMLDEIDLDGCKANLKNLAVASEMYSVDNKGQYPLTLSKLTPAYLKVIMPCPATHSDTYSSSISHAPDAYTIFCQGHHHEGAGVAPNFPQYSSYSGIAPKAP